MDVNILEAEAIVVFYGGKGRGGLLQCGLVQLICWPQRQVVLALAAAEKGVDIDKHRSSRHGVQLGLMYLFCPSNRADGAGAKKSGVRSFKAKGRAGI